MKFSPVRQGIDPLNQKKLDIHGLFKKSMSINNTINPPSKDGDMTNEERGNILKGRVYSDLESRKIKMFPQINNISFANTMTPQERILTSLFKRKRDVSNKRKIIDSNLPIVFTTAANRMAHQLATNEMIEKYTDFINKSERDPKIKESINRAMYYMDKMGNEFIGILKEGSRISAMAREDEIDIKGNYDHMEKMSNLTDKWIDIFDSMSKEEQVISTIYWFHGIKETDTRGDEVIRSYRLHLPPTKLLHKKTLNLFLDLWDEKVRSLDKDFKVPSGENVLKHRRKLSKINFETFNNTVDEKISNMCH